MIVNKADGLDPNTLKFYPLLELDVENRKGEKCVYRGTVAELTRRDSTLVIVFEPNTLECNTPLGWHKMRSLRLSFPFVGFEQTTLGGLKMQIIHTAGHKILHLHPEHNYIL